VSPRVSVAMAVHDGERYLAQAVESILAQTFEDFELLALDDGSTDESREILEGFAKRDSRVRVRSRRNRGLVASLNELVEEAQGEYLARMDADDVALPERFARQVAHLDAHPECVLLGTRVLLVDPEDAPLRPFAELCRHEEIDREHLAGRGGAICHPSAMMRNRVVREVGGYDASKPYAEDLDLFLRLAEIGRLENLPDTLLWYRMHPESMGHRFREKQRASAAAAVQEACRRRGLPSPTWTETAPSQGGSGAETHRRWAWWALGAGHVATARKHAWAALRREPWTVKSWKAMACAIRGY